MGILVIDELHRLELREGAQLNGVARVGIGHIEQRIGRIACPDLAQVDIDGSMTEHVEPEALLEREFGGLVVEVGAHHAVVRHLVRQFEDGVAMIDTNARSLVLGKCLLGSPAKRSRSQSHVVVALFQARARQLELAQTGLVFAAQVGLQLEADVVPELERIEQRVAADIDELRLVGLAERGDEVVAVGFEHEAQLLRIVGAFELERMDGELVGVALLAAERILERGVVLPFVVLDGINHVARTEEVVVQIGRRDAAHAQTDVFEAVPRNRRVDGAIEELGALLHLVVNRHEALEEPGQHLLAIFVERHSAHLVHHRLDRPVGVEACGGTMGVPIGQIGRIAHQVGRIRLGGSAEDGLVERRVAEVAVTDHALRIETQRTSRDIQFRIEALAQHDACAVGQTSVLELDVQIAHEVEVDVGRDVELGTLYPVGTVEADVEVSDKAERLRHGGRKTQVDVIQTVVELQRVEDIIFIEGGTKRRDGRNELLAIEVDVVLVEVHLGEDLGLEQGHELFGHHVVHTCVLFGLGDGTVQVAGILPIMLLHTFVGRNGQHGCAGDDGGVDELLDELELLLPTGQMAAAEVVQRIGHVVVAGFAEEVVLLGRMVVLVLDDVANEDDGGVVLAAIAFPLGLDHHLAELHVLRHHLDDQFHLAVAGHDGLGVVAEITELDGTARTCQHRKVTLSIRNGTIGGTFFSNIHEVEGQTGDATQQDYQREKIIKTYFLIHNVCKDTKILRVMQILGTYIR